MPYVAALAALEEVCIADSKLALAATGGSLLHRVRRLLAVTPTEGPGAGAFIGALSFFVVLGVIKLRITHPDLPRPYRAWGYPISPLVFLLVTGFMMYYLLTTQPLRSMLGLLIMVSGLLIYAIFHKQSASGPAAAPLARE